MSIIYLDYLFIVQMLSSHILRNKNYLKSSFLFLSKYWLLYLMIMCLLNTLEHDAFKVYGQALSIFSKTILILASFRIQKHILLCILLLFMCFLKNSDFPSVLELCSCPFLYIFWLVATKQKICYKNNNPYLLPQ